MMDFAAARRAVQQHLDGLYAEERENPKVLGHGFDTGDAFAPMIDWDGVMGVYTYLVDKRSGELKPLSRPEFEDVPDPQRVGEWPGVSNESRLHHALTRARERLREGMPVNHPGHPDQKSHGRKRVVRAALDRAKTIDELNTAAAAEAKRITGRDIAFDMAGSDLQLAKEHVEGVMKGLERYPDAPLEKVKQGLPRLYERVGMLALTNDAGTEISFSTSAQARGADAYRADLRQAELNGDVVSGSPAGVALHEFGHVVAVRAQAAPAAAATAQRMASGKGQDTQHYIAERVSNYATESSDELAAEAFADVMSFGRSGASPLSRAIVDEMDTLYTGAGS